MRDLGVALFILMCAVWFFPEDIGERLARIQKGFLNEVFAEDAQ